MPNRRAMLAPVNLPDFGMPAEEPTLSASLYAARLERLRSAGEKAGYDTLVIYGDREHAANLHYLTGYDPRFEEALLLLDLRQSDPPRLLVGNEGMAYTAISPIRDQLTVELYQPFSLMGQPRANSRMLREILADSGVGQGKQIGAIGWKYYTELETENPETTLEIPAYLADLLRELAGARDLVRNAGALLMHPTDGLRATLEVEQLARFEYAACLTSDAVRRVIFGLQPGMSEYELVQKMALNGFPQSVHLMLSSGARTGYGLASPSSKRIERGDPMVTAFGLHGALNCRAGFVAESAADLPDDIGDYVEKLVAPYFEAAVAWYEMVGIGVAGGDLYRAVHDRIGDPFFGVTLNPGHLIGLDEWVHSPVEHHSTLTLQSGMAIQVDIIPGTGTRYFTSNLEDGIALADADLRAAFAAQYPEAWARIQARRAFMENSLGIRLKPEVLPFSNLAGYLPPFWLNPAQAMVMG